MVNLRDNTRLWDRVKHTDPRFTKKVNKGAYSFTAIDAHYNVLKATAEWGPWGVGWGWDDKDGWPQLIEGVLHVSARLWYMEEIGMDDSGAIITAKRICSPVEGTAKLTGTNRNGPYVDDEAMKKARTDFLSKSFSYLGFSADVYLGFFDNHKYVESMRSRFNKEKENE